MAGRLILNTAEKRIAMLFVKRPRLEGKGIKPDADAAPGAGFGLQSPQQA